MSNDQPYILIYSENHEVLAELHTIGRQLANQYGAKLAAVLIGEYMHKYTDMTVSMGSDSVVIIHTEEKVEASTELKCEALLQAVNHIKPRLLLIGATRIGSELAAQLAQCHNIPNANECMSLQYNDVHQLEIERRIYGGRFIIQERMDGVFSIATVQLKRFPQAEAIQREYDAEIIEMHSEISKPRVRRINKTERSRSEVDISKADIVIAAGRGIKSIDDLEMLHTLANILGGVVAGSRPLTGDVDWLPQDRRIGLSGQTIKPNLYIACGISGQIEHIVGMKGARTVVSINNDPKAPIHAESDYSIIGDLYDVVPELINACNSPQANT